MKKAVFALLITALLCHGTAAIAAVEYKIVTASARGTYIIIGRDLAQFVASSAGIDLDALPSAGSAENVRRLRYEPGVKFALVQSDVYQAFLDMAAGGNAEAGDMIRPLRVIMPLYNEEIYFVVRADSDRNYVHEIRNAKINAGQLGSGTALTSATLYRLMFGEPMSETNATYLSNEDALVKLITDKTVDVVAIVAGQPAKLLARHEARGAPTYQASQVRSQSSIQQGGPQDLFSCHGTCQQLSKPACGGSPRVGGQGLSRHLRFPSEGRRESLEAVRAFAVQELPDAARKGAPEVARGRAGSA